MIKIGPYEYGTVDDLAKTFGRTPKTIYRWIAEGKIPRGGKSPRGMIWRMDKLAKALNKNQASDKAYIICAENF